MKRWVNTLVWLPVVCVCFASCGDDAKKNVVRAVAGEGGEGGQAPEPAAGGSEAMPTTGGAGGNPAPETAGMGGVMEVSGGMGGVSGGAGGVGPVELSCLQAMPGGAGAGGDPYGGGEWRDFAANTCRSCPVVSLVCDDLVGPPAAYDSDSGVLTLQVAAGTSEVVTADFTYRYYDGQGFPEVTAPAQVDENVLTFQVGPVAPLPTQIWGELAVEDGCGDQKVLGLGDDWLSLQRIDPAAGGAGGEGPVTYEVRCDYD